MHITTVPGTLLAFFDGQISYMRSRGFRVCAVCSPGESIARIVERDDIDVHRIPMARKISPISDMLALFKLVKLFRRLKPAIVHAHTPKGGFLGMLAAFIARVPVRVFTLHGLRSSGNMSSLKKIIVEIGEAFTCKLAHKVFAVSYGVRDLTLKRKYCNNNKIEVLANGSCNGIDAREKFNPENYTKHDRERIRRQHGISSDSFVLCFVGRIVKDKGIEELIDAWQVLRNDFDNFYLMALGVCEEIDPIRAETREILKQDDRIIMPGRVQNIPEYYNAVDLVVLPTYREGFPYVPLESGAMNLCVVGTNVIGCNEVIVDGETGILVEPQDSVDLYDAIKKLIGDEQLRNKFGKAARERVLKDFSQEVIWQYLENRYRELLDEKFGAGLSL